MDAAYLLPTGGLMAQADWLGPKVDGHLMLLLAYIHRVHRSHPCNRFPMLRRIRNCQSYYYYYYKDFKAIGG